MTDAEIIYEMTERAELSFIGASGGLPEGDLLREIILGLVPSLCAMDLSTDPEIRRKTFWWLRDELNRYSAKCREKAVTLELCKSKPN